MRRIAFLLALVGACSLPAQQQADLCPGPPCAPGAASLGDACGTAKDGICSADGACLPPCLRASDCPAAKDPSPCMVPACDAVSAACTYVVIDGVQCGAGGVCSAGSCKTAGAGF